MSLLAKYKNGNYTVKIYSDGTKIKGAPRQEPFIAAFPDSIDLKITNYCDMNCPMCHENSSTKGQHAELFHAFFETMTAGTEVAIGGGNPLSHPELEKFLVYLKERRIIANITVNEQHFLQNAELLDRFMHQNLIHGLGISLNAYDPKTLDFALEHPNVVFHLIAGIVTEDNIKTLTDYSHDFKILILGYKEFGRGKAYINAKIRAGIRYMSKNIISLMKSFNVVSFDNLALEQLKIKEKVSPYVWEKHFMGEDGEASMYIDLVKEMYAISSTSLRRFPLRTNIRSMFQKLKTVPRDTTAYVNLPE